MTTPATNADAPSYAAPTAAGRFVWHDLMTTDATRALAFYSALFGWTAQPFPLGEMGDYQMLQAGDQGIGGIVPLDAAQGMPPHWISYVSTPSVDATCARAEALGGKVHVPPTDIPNVGRFAVVSDPQGAFFSPFASNDPSPEPPANAPAGTVAWNELLTTDPQAAAAFYEALFGWTHEVMDMPMGQYWLFKRGAPFAGGMMPMPADAGSPPTWLPYFAVASADVAAASITALGGTVMMAPMDIQDWGRMTVAQDPTGAYFAVLENKSPM